MKRTKVYQYNLFGRYFQFHVVIAADSGKYSDSKDSSDKREKAHEESVTIKKTHMNEKLAEEIEKQDIECKALTIGSTAIENQPYYSHTFAMDPKFVTNKGVVQIKGRNINLIQIIQRN